MPTFETPPESKAVPHYLMGGLVRYRLSELSAWATRSTAVQGRDAQDADAPVEGAE